MDVNTSTRGVEDLATQAAMCLQQMMEIVCQVTSREMSQPKTRGDVLMVIADMQRRLRRPFITDSITHKFSQS